MSEQRAAIRCRTPLRAVGDAAGATVTHAAAVRGGARLRLRFADGQAAVTADPAS